MKRSDQSQADSCAARAERIISSTLCYSGGLKGLIMPPLLWAIRNSPMTEDNALTLSTAQYNTEQLGYYTETLNPQSPFGRSILPYVGDLRHSVVKQREESR